MLTFFVSLDDLAAACLLVNAILDFVWHFFTTLTFTVSLQSAQEDFWAQTLGQFLLMLPRDGASHARHCPFFVALFKMSFCITLLHTTIASVACLLAILP